MLMHLLPTTCHFQQKHNNAFVPQKQEDNGQKYNSPAAKTTMSKHNEHIHWDLVHHSMEDSHTNYIQNTIQSEAITPKKKEKRNAF